MATESLYSGVNCPYHSTCADSQGGRTHWHRNQGHPTWVIPPSEQVQVTKRVSWKNLGGLLNVLSFLVITYTIGVFMAAAETFSKRADVYALGGFLMIGVWCGFVLVSIVIALVHDIVIVTDVTPV